MKETIKTKRLQVAQVIGYPPQNGGDAINVRFNRCSIIFYTHVTGCGIVKSQYVQVYFDTKPLRILKDLEVKQSPNPNNAIGLIALSCNSCTKRVNCKVTMYNIPEPV